MRTRELYPVRTPCDPQIMAYQDEWEYREAKWMQEKEDRRREINMHEPEIIEEIAEEKGELCMECGHHGQYRGGLCVRCWQEEHA